MSKTIGIDLGTVYSCVASMIDGQGVVIPDEDGHHTQPSVFAINNNQEVLIGRRAIAQHNSNPLGTIFAVKRLIGLKYDSPEIELARQKLPYRILRAANGDAWVEVNGKPVSPEEISAQIILRMKQIAERYFGEKVYRAVITVPAHFNDSQRQATRDAGRIAGLDVMRIINEPTAASLAYGMDKSLHSGKSIQDIQERTIAVFDLGGGTFDVSILEMRRGTFVVKSTHGDCYLGGEDIDLCIVNFLVEAAKATLNVDLQKDKLAMQRIKVAAQDAKHKLSAAFEVTIELPYIARGMKNLIVRLNRDSLEKLVEPVLQRLEIPCLAAIEDANITPKQITDVVLVGGQTRMPAVKNYCRRIFGSVPRDDIDPDKAVAVGAAIQAALLDGLLDGVRFEDVLPLTLGIEIQGGLTQPIIPRNTKVPVQVTKIFTTTTPNQERVTIHVLQGESKFAPNNETMGRFELSDIPPQPRGYPEIAVSFAVDAGGMISVTAQDLDTGEEKHCQIVASSGLDDKELEELLRASRLREEQEDRQRYTGSENDTDIERNQTSSDLSVEKEKLKSLLYHTQFVLDSQGDGYKGAARNNLEQILKTSRDYLEKTPTRETLLLYIDTLEAEADKLAEFLAKPW